MSQRETSEFITHTYRAITCRNAVNSQQRKHEETGLWYSPDALKSQCLSGAYSRARMLPV